jgi:hypothetical protein
VITTVKCVEKRVQCVTSWGIRDIYFGVCAKVYKHESNKKGRGFKAGTA